MSIKKNIGTYLNINLRTAGKSEIKQLFGKDHLVVPMIALVEGVITPGNNATPQLALASEFGRFPEGWDGRPVVFNHPIVGNGPSSANDPKVLEDYAVGTLFNTRVEKGSLKTEAWIDEARFLAIDNKLSEPTLNAIKANEMVEVSTGLFADLEEADGSYNGDEFTGIWRNVVPDHLAVLELGSTGACSNEDGCGIPRVNSAASSATSLEPLVNEDGDLTLKNEPCPECHVLKAIVLNENSSFTDREIAIAESMRDLELEDFFFMIAVYDDTFVYASFDGLFQREYSISDNGDVTIGGEKTKVRPKTQFVPVKAEVSDNSGEPTDNSSPDDSPLTSMEEPMKPLVKILIDSALNHFTDANAEWLETLDDAQLEAMQPVIIVDNSDEGDAAAAAAVTAEEFIAGAPPSVQEMLNDGLRMHKQKKELHITALLANKQNQFSREELDAMDIDGLTKLTALAKVTPNFEGLDGGASTLQPVVTTNADGQYAPEAPKAFERK